jgi:hypothetical protein
MGLGKDEHVMPSVKTLGYFQLRPQYYEVAYETLIGVEN